MAKKKVRVRGERPMNREMEELFRLGAKHSRLKYELLEKYHEFKEVDKQLAELEEKIRGGR